MNQHKFEINVFEIACQCYKITSLAISLTFNSSHIVISVWLSDEIPLFFFLDLTELPLLPLIVFNELDVGVVLFDDDVGFKNWCSLDEPPPRFLLFFS